MEIKYKKRKSTLVEDFVEGEIFIYDASPWMVATSARNNGEIYECEQKVINQNCIIAINLESGNLSKFANKVEVEKIVNAEMIIER